MKKILLVLFVLLSVDTYALPLAKVEAGRITSTLSSDSYATFEFIATRDGKITISANSCNVAIYNERMATYDCINKFCKNPNYAIIDGKQGISYIICLRNNSCIDSVQWSIEESDWLVGERCSDPIDVYSLDNLPINHDSGTDKWYRFVALRDGDITITSANATTEDTYLEVYEGCGSGRVAFSDDAVGMQSELVLSVKTNKAYYIKWDNIFQPKQYAWSVVYSVSTSTESMVHEHEITVYDTMGMLIYKGVDKDVNLHDGIYIVKRGNKVMKTLVIN